MADFHLGGLASNYDVQSIIDSMLKVRQVPRQRWVEEQDALVRDVAAWSDISAAMTDLTDSLDVLRSSETWGKMLAGVSDATKLSATAGSSATKAIYRVGVSQLAQAHSLGTDSASELGVANASANLVVPAGSILTGGDQFTITSGGDTITITVDATTESLSTLSGKINTAATGMSAANRVTASIMDNRLVITRNNSGSDQITMADILGGSALADLGVFTVAPTLKHEFVEAQDAEFTVNGIDMVRSSNTNLADVISGVNLNLLDETTSDVTLTIGNDTETPKNAILSFIEAYNAAATTLDKYGKVDVKGSGAKGATIDAETMGELSDDPLVAELIRNIRSQATDSKYPTLNPVNASYTFGGLTGTMDSLDDIGIWTTDRTNSLSLVDEVRLDSGLENYFDKVEQLFRGVYDAEEGYRNGVASDFYEYAENASTSMTGSIAQHVSKLNEKYDDRRTTIEEFDADTETYTQELWNEFTAMEETISKLQAQLAGLQQIQGK